MSCFFHCNRKTFRNLFSNNDAVNPDPIPYPTTTFDRNSTFPLCSSLYEERWDSRHFSTHLKRFRESMCREPRLKINVTCIWQQLELISQLLPITGLLSCVASPITIEKRSGCTSYHTAIPKKALGCLFCNLPITVILGGGKAVLWWQWPSKIIPCR